MGTRRGSPLLVWPIYTIPPAQLTSDQTNRRSSVVSETDTGQDKGGGKPWLFNVILKGELDS
jgi:hypothetical protein